MDGARLPEKTRSEMFEDTIDLNKDTPETMRRAGVVAGMDMILRKADRVRDLVRHFVDGDRDAEPLQKLDGCLVKRGHRLWLKRKAVRPATARAGKEPMVNEIELDLDDLGTDRDRQGAETASGNIKRDLPAVIE